MGFAVKVRGQNVWWCASKTQDGPGRFRVRLVNDVRSLFEIFDGENVQIAKQEVDSVEEISEFDVEFDHSEGTIDDAKDYKSWYEL